MDTHALETKKTFVTEKLLKRDEERLAELQKRKDEKESTQAENEKSDYFTENFQKFKSDLQSQIEKCPTIPKQDLQEHFDSMSITLQSMQKFLTDSTVFLPAREVLKSQEAISKIQSDIQLKRDDLLPKKKFAFKGKKKIHVPKKVEEPKQIEEKSLINLGIDMVDCNFSDRIQEQLIKTGGEINNKDVALSKLENCTVKLIGSPSAIHINNLTSCKVLCGPVSGSIFIDDCIDCTFVVACQQLRIHSTTKTQFYIHVTSKAIIEDCQNVNFASYNWSYDGLDSHYQLSGLDRGINNWADVDDFNWLASDKASPNWNVITESERIKDWNL